ENCTPSSCVHALARIDDVLAALFDVVVRADGHRFDLLLRADHMLEGRAELGGKAPVRDEYEADHRVPRRRVRVAPHERAPIITILSPCARAFPRVWGWCCIAIEPARRAAPQPGSERRALTSVSLALRARIMTEG